jgi:hypothetical protein
MGKLLGKWMQQMWCEFSKLFLLGNDKYKIEDEKILVWLILSLKKVEYVLTRNLWPVLEQA